ncbi:MAG: MoaD/ThiS family protein [Candidatus Hydrogenedentes bacterium]|nr:MoaD/ThiS family protein [Candidatus Hydrogenedentota bacterium]
MPTVYIPSPMQSLCGGKPTVEVDGSTVRQVVEALDRAYPGMEARLVESGRIRSNISVAIDGEVTTLGMIEWVGENSEVHFLPAISGGRHERPSGTKPSAHSLVSPQRR